MDVLATRESIHDGGGGDENGGIVAVQRVAGGRASVPVAQATG